MRKMSKNEMAEDTIIRNELKVREGVEKIGEAKEADMFHGLEEQEEIGQA